MRWGLRLALSAVFLAAPALGETPLSAEAFEARTTGRTMTYADDGQVWGREQYLSDRRVIWAFEGEECKRGIWDEVQPGLICFAYEDAPDDTECWHFFDREGRLFAQLEHDTDAMSLAAVDETAKGLVCGGLGV
ncbi:MAG: hypothetical protein K9G43_02620 [Rhodobacteraceae bacterium]|nr:hypothetical protein [Paracoccaceae bacterium]